MAPSWCRTSCRLTHRHDINEPNVDERYDTPYDKFFCYYVRRSDCLITMPTGLPGNAGPEFTRHDS